MARKKRQPDSWQECAECGWKGTWESVVVHIDAILDATGFHEFGFGGFLLPVCPLCQGNVEYKRKEHAK